MSDVRKRATELFNSLSYEDRANKAGLGYSLAQLDTIISMRIRNKEALRKYDRELAAWQKNIERHIEKDLLQPPTKGL